MKQQKEKQLNYSRIALHDELGALKGLGSTIDGVEELMKMYHGNKGESFAGQSTLLDDFGREAMNRLRLVGLPQSTESLPSTSNLEMPSETLAGQTEMDVVVEDRSLETQQALRQWDNLQHLHESTQASASGTYVEPAAEEEVLRKEAAKFLKENAEFAVYFYPLWTEPSTGGLLVADEERKSPLEISEEDEEVLSDDKTSSPSKCPPISVFPNLHHMS